MYNHSVLRLFTLLFLTWLTPSTLSAQSILQKMLDETNDGDTLYIEKNDYVSANSITLSGRKNMTLVFEVGATVTCTSQFQDIFVIQNCSDIQIYNGTFRHLVSEETKSFGSGFYLFQSQNIHIYGIDLDNNGINGLFAQSVNHLELYKSFIHNNSTSAYLFQEKNGNIILKGNLYENNGIDGDEIYNFKKQASETDPFESIDEKALSVFESDTMDSIRTVQQKMFPKIKAETQNPTVSKAVYDSINYQPLVVQDFDALILPAWMERSLESGNSVVCINIPEQVKQYVCSITGLTKFDTKDVIEFFKYDEPNFTNMPPKAFLKGIQSDVIYLNESTPTNIHWNCDPELEQMALELKNKNIQQIAVAQETVVYRMLQVWEKYQTAGLLFEKFRFEIVGNCRFMRSQYHPETELLDATLSLNDIYLATLRIPISPSDIKQLFFNREDFTVFFKMQVHPGLNETTLNMGINSPLMLPNLVVMENPSIQCMNQKGMEFRFNSYGLAGTIWNSNSSNKEYKSSLLGGFVSRNSRSTVVVKIPQGKSVLPFKSNDVINRIVKTMEYYSKSMGDCYFGFANNGQKIMENVFPFEQKDKQYLVYTLENQAEAEYVKKALIAKGLHFANNFTQGQVVFCYTKQLK